MDDVEVVVAHAERATLRVGEMFLKVDSDPARTAREREAMAWAPIPTAEVLWMQPSVLALAGLPGRPLGRLGEPDTATSTAWIATGAAVRRLHEAAVPPWASLRDEDRAETLARECAALVAEDILSRELVDRSRELAETALRPWRPAFIHGDLQVGHVFLDDHDRVTGVLDWSEAGPGDPAYDLATLTLGHRERLDDVLRGYGSDVDREVVRGWWALRSLTGIRWLLAHGFDAFAPGCEVDVLRSLT